MSSKLVRELTEADFSQNVLQKQGVQVVDFGAPWCAPCLALEPILEDLAKDFTNVPVYSVNVDKSMDLAAQYGIKSLPTVVVFKNGEIVEQLIGKQAGVKYREILANLA